MSKKSFAIKLFMQAIWFCVLYSVTFAASYIALSGYTIWLVLDYHQRGLIDIEVLNRIFDVTPPTVISAAVVALPLTIGAFSILNKIKDRRAV